ncbi:MBL fold metallo-hydrolase [Methylobacter sp.]|uniref:MBL fold metallo-hydrolase n=1 Tax=Methylobacter sp. TaxID=2051955 RepID=UPI00120766F6|nr:MBL fold metallo-hydrolase [Methylobacter sp.]TAK65201.1 MAG: MBL fold metallo-hydrolase [Methylobacter sp.]
MKKATIIYQSGQHQWIAIARDPERPNYLIDTNEYLITDGSTALLTDPGGSEIFAMVFAAICEAFDPANISALFASHQDPDIISSLSLWLDFKPELKCHLSRLWTTFVPHFGGSDQTLIGIPDEGSVIAVGKLKLQAVPAHYLHSSGNFNLYDPAAKLLFSGDIGSAMLPEELNALFVKDFDRHIHYAEGFHKRWMGSPEAKRLWCERVAVMDIDMLCPQHGAIYQGADVDRFINWFSELQVGSGLL